MNPEMEIVLIGPQYLLRNRVKYCIPAEITLREYNQISNEWENHIKKLTENKNSLFLIIPDTHPNQAKFAKLFNLCYHLADNIQFNQCPRIFLHPPYEQKCRKDSGEYQSMISDLERLQTAVNEKFNESPIYLCYNQITIDIMLKRIDRQAKREVKKEEKYEQQFKVLLLKLNKKTYSGLRDAKTKAQVAYNIIFNNSGEIEMPALRLVVENMFFKNMVKKFFPPVAFAERFEVLPFERVLEGGPAIKNKYYTYEYSNEAAQDKNKNRKRKMEASSSSKTTDSENDENDLSPYKRGKRFAKEEFASYSGNKQKKEDPRITKKTVNKLIAQALEENIPAEMKVTSFDPENDDDYTPSLKNIWNTLQKQSRDVQKNIQNLANDSQLLKNEWLEKKNDIDSRMINLQEEGRRINQKLLKQEKLLERIDSLETVQEATNEKFETTEQKIEFAEKKIEELLGKFNNLQVEEKLEEIEEIEEIDPLEKDDLSESEIIEDGVEYNPLQPTY